MEKLSDHWGTKIDIKKVTKKGLIMGVRGSVYQHNYRQKLGVHLEFDCAFRTPISN